MSIYIKIIPYFSWSRRNSRMTTPITFAFLEVFLYYFVAGSYDMQKVKKNIAYKIFGKFNDNIYKTEKLLLSYLNF